MNKQKRIRLALIFLLIFRCGASGVYAQTLGQRNNNPLNLKYYDKWKGLSGTDKYNHCIFASLEYGIRAGLINLRNHIRNNQEETLLHYLGTFAEANSKEEAEFVAQRLGISISTRLKNINLVDFFIALTEFESRIILTKEQVISIMEKYKI